MTKAGVVLVSVSLFAFACGETVTGPEDVTGVLWRLQSLQRADASVITPPAATFTLRFADEGRLEIRADCNGCGGNYTLSGEAMSAGPFICTLAFCPTAPFDSEYVHLVDAATTVERNGDTLILRSPDGVLRFQP
jgi:heat shock protein HslJ